MSFFRGREQRGVGGAETKMKKKEEEEGVVGGTL